MNQLQPHTRPNPPLRVGDAAPARSESLVPRVEHLGGLEAGAPPDAPALLGTLRRHVLLILATAFAATGVAAYVALTRQPSYRASAVIRLSDPRRELAGGLLDRADEAGHVQARDPLLSQLQILTMRSVAGEVVDSQPLGLRVRTFGFSPRLLDSVTVQRDASADTLHLRFASNVLTVSGAAGERQVAYGEAIEMDGVRFVMAAAPDVEEGGIVIRARDAAIGSLLGGLSAEPREGTDVVDVKYTATDPRVAQQVVNRVVQVFEATSAHHARQQSRRRREFIEAQFRHNDSLLVQAERELSDFRSREQAYSSRDKLAAEQAGLTGLEVRREELEADRRMYQSLLTRLQGPGSSRTSETLRTLASSPDVAANPVMVQLHSQLARYELTRDSLTTGPWASAPSHPDVQRLDTLIAATQMRLVGAVRSHIDALEARITALDGLKARASSALQELSASESEEVHFVQQVDLLRKLSDDLRQEHQQARISEAAVAGQVEIMDLATVPPIPIGSGPAPMILFGLLVGLLAGAGGAFLLEQFNTSIRSREDLEATLRLPGLATIPRITGREHHPQLRRLARLVGARNGSRRPNGHAPRVVTLADVHSSAAEAFRTLRTNLLFSQVVRSLRTVVVTSASPAEGKTTTAANLAATFAQQGWRVLLVDCDLRQPSAHTMFGARRDPGLTELLMGGVTAREAVRSTEVDRLAVLPSGTPPPNPSELLGSEVMRQVLRALNEEYELLVLDSPPMLAAGDAAVLSQLSDAVLLVARAGRTDRAAAQEALRQLASIGAHVVGAVLNDPDSKTGHYTTYVHYEYYGARA